MKRANGGRSGFSSRDFLAGRGDKLGNALMHFPCGLVGKRDSQDIPRRNPALDHVRNAMRNHASLARTRPGKDQNRAANGLDGQPLLRVQGA